MLTRGMDSSVSEDIADLRRRSPEYGAVMHNSLADAEFVRYLIEQSRMMAA